MKISRTPVPPFTAGRRLGADPQERAECDCPTPGTCAAEGCIAYLRGDDEAAERPAVLVALVVCAITGTAVGFLLGWVLT